MANSTNVWMGVGNLTRDPELRFITNGTAVCDFGVALNRKYNDKEETTFVDVTVWSKLAELCGEHLTKGGKVAIVGRLKLDTWETKDGQKRSKLVVVANDVEFLYSKKNENADRDVDETSKQDANSEKETVAVGDEEAFQ